MSKNILAVYSPYYGLHTPILKYDKGQLATVSPSAPKGYYFDPGSKSPIYYDGSVNRPLLPSHSSGKFCTVSIEYEVLYTLPDWFNYFKLEFKRKEPNYFNKQLHQDFCLGLIDYIKKAELEVADKDVGDIYNRLVAKAMIPEQLARAVLRPYFDRGGYFTIPEWKATLENFNTTVSDDFEYAEITSIVHSCKDCGTLYPLPYFNSAVFGELAMEEPIGEESCPNCGSHNITKIMIMDYLVYTIGNQNILESHIKK